MRWWLIISRQRHKTLITWELFGTHNRFRCLSRFRIHVWWGGGGMQERVRLTTRPISQSRTAFLTICAGTRWQWPNTSISARLANAETQNSLCTVGITFGPHKNICICFAGCVWFLVVVLLLLAARLLISSFVFFFYLIASCEITTEQICHYV